MIQCFESQFRASTRVISVRKLREHGAKDQNATAECLRRWRAGEIGMGWPWSPETVPTAELDATEVRKDLAAMIHEAKTDEDRVMCAHEVARMVALGLLGPQEAREIRSPLDSARASADKARKNSPPKEDPRSLLLASETAMKAARALDYFVSDERREKILEHIADELEADYKEHPNRDMGGA